MKTPKTEAVTETKPQRRVRTPVSGPRDILTVMQKDSNYVYRWVMDKPGRLQRFRDAGYEIVNHETEVGDVTVDQGSRLGSAITHSTGGSLLVLMRIRKEWYNEDQDSKQKDLDSLEEVLYQDGLKSTQRTLGGTTPSQSEDFRKAR